MPENLCHHLLVLDAGDDPQFPATPGAGLNIDREHSLEALHPDHVSPTLIGAYRVLRVLRNYP